MQLNPIQQRSSKNLMLHRPRCWQEAEMALAKVRTVSSVSVSPDFTHGGNPDKCADVTVLQDLSHKTLDVS